MKRLDVERGADGEYYINVKVRRKATRRELERYMRENPLEIPHELMTLDGSGRLKARRTYTQDAPEQRLLLPYKYPPLFIIFISIFQLVAFIYYVQLSDVPLTLYGPVPFRSKLIYNPYRRYEIWRYLTYMFIHAGYWHITFNLLTQLIVGIPLERAHRFDAVFVIYLGGIIGGALGNSIADPHSYLAGASSGCYALIAAHLSNLIINWTEIRGACCRLFVFLLVTGYDFGTAVYERHFKDGSLTYRTSYVGHLAGALSGLLLGLIFLKNARVLDWEVEVRRWSSALYVGLIIFTIVYNLTNPDYFPLPDKSDLIWSVSPFGYDREQ